MIMLYLLSLFATFKMIVHLIILIAIILLLYVLITFSFKNHDYWKKRNVPHLKPIPFFGNHKESLLFKKHIAQVAQEICEKFPAEPYIGSLYGTKPALIVQDISLIKLILSSDFYYFSGREASDYSTREPITRNLFYSGGDNWKIQRQNLTPLFSATKIKNMFHLIKDCAQQLDCLLQKETKTNPYIDVRELLARYTIDCIVSCGFGFDSNTMKTPDANPFMLIGKNIFNTSYYSAFKKYCRIIWPSLFYGVKLTLYDEKLYSFFHSLLSKIFDSRSKIKSSRNDFVDLVLTWAQRNYISGASLCNSSNSEKKTVSLEVNNDLLVGQCVLFFGAGYETTATTLSFILYELAKNQDVQEELIKEIDSYFTTSNGKIEYECVQQLPYLDSCVTEALRLYPVLGVITREVMEDYTFPTGLTLQKGDMIHIPVQHIHYHPEYFPQPEQFRPERFYGEEKKNIVPYTYLAFGEGPRKCLGYRFSMMPMYASLLTIFKTYRLELAENMPRSVKLKATSLVITPASAINLKFISRKI